MITAALSMLVNAFYNVRDGKSVGQAMDITSSIIPMILVVTDDIPVDVRQNFANSLEVINCVAIRSILTSLNFDRGNSSPKKIFKTIPFLTHYDPVGIDKYTNALHSITDSIFGEKGETGTNKNAIGVFMESYQENFYQNLSISYESDIFLKEARSSLPTFVEIALPIQAPLGGKGSTKTLSIGVSVTPIVKSKEEFMQMVIKQNMNVPEAKKQEGFWNKMKNLLSFTQKKVNKEGVGDVKTLNDMINKTKGINKPFINLMCSRYVANELLYNHKIDVTKDSYVQGLMNKLPVASFAVYDSNMDTITSSTLKGLPVSTRSTADFDTEIDKMQKQLAEVVRYSKTGL